jgi:hypothetical protein
MAIYFVATPRAPDMQHEGLNYEATQFFPTLNKDMPSPFFLKMKPLYIKANKPPH